MRRLLFGTLCLIALPFSAVSAQTIKGHILDKESGQPVDVATVRLYDEKGEEWDKVVTDHTGAFRFTRLDDGLYRIKVERIGFKTVTFQDIKVEPHELVDVALRVSADAIAIAPLEVRGRKKLPPHLDLVGFSERRKAGFGTFLTREQIKPLRNGSLTDVLRTMPGVVVTPGSNLGNAPGVYMARSALRSGTCRPTIYLDGMPVQKSDIRPGGLEPRIDDLIVPDEMDGIEVYRGESEAPMQFGGRQARCGVILIWSIAEEDDVKK